MSDERTPLIAVVNVQPTVRERYPHHRLRRVCTIILVTIPVFIGVLVLLALILPDKVWDKTPFRDAGFAGLSSLDAGRESSWPGGHHVGYDELTEILASTPDEEKIAKWSKHYTGGPHLAGKNLSLALWTKEKWAEFGVPRVDIQAYDVYINYPKDHRLALVEKPENDETIGDYSEGWTVKFEASLEEDVLPEDDTSGLDDRVPTFHGYSASGNVTAPYVYVNYGTYWDFEDLIAAGVSLEGKIALAKYGGNFRGLKVRRAQELGMVGVVMYSDPGDDGDVTEENGHDHYPKGPARHPSAVQRGSVQFLSIAPGDPTTPGYPSLPGAPRQPVDNAIPSIPSLPISYKEAIPLLKALNGHGPKAAGLNKYWEGGGLGYKGVDYNIGPTPDSLALNLHNEQEYVTTPLWNVIGVINGTIPDEVIVMGNHRDAWIAGGAGDPNSGSASMLELVRGLGEALERGWKPLRTIVLASWDGEEYGLLGSTEWVEEYLPWLSNSAVAYINVDVSVRGPDFSTAAAPLLHNILSETTEEILSPNQTKFGQTVYDVWDKKIRSIGSGSDFTAFQDFAGIPCVDMGFGDSSGHNPVYHYHSNYDSWHWMETFGDPGWHYHATAARLWGLLAAKLVESPVLPLSASNYATELEKYLQAVKRKAATQIGIPPGDDIPDKIERIFYSATIALGSFDATAKDFDAEAAELAAEFEEKVPWWQFWKRVQQWKRARKLNTAIKLLERQFLYAPGLDSRPWFKHVVFAPGKWTGYAGATFPGLVEGIEDGDKDAVRKWVGIVSGLISNAEGLLFEAIA